MRRQFRAFDNDRRLVFVGGKAAQSGTHQIRKDNFYGRSHQGMCR
jgi:hypothetical protein